MPDDAAEKPARAQDCYSAAYTVLPHYAFESPDKLLAQFAEDPDYAAKFFTLMGCRVNEREPDEELLRTVRGHSGTLDERFDYHAVQYPPFPPVNVTHLPGDQAVAAMARVVLAPVFSAIVYTKGGTVANYFVLGQSPDGHTTFREVTPEVNANLGPGCDPDLSRFVELIRARLRAGAAAPEPVAGVHLSPPGIFTTSREPRRKRRWEFWK